MTQFHITCVMIQSLDLYGHTTPLPLTNVEQKTVALSALGTGNAKCPKKSVCLSNCCHVKTVVRI